MNLIEENVNPDAVIYTDGWRGYAGLAEHGYDHRVVLHNQGFGTGLDTTNGIESCWSQIKRLSDFYRGIQAVDPNVMGQVQAHVTHGVWLRHIENQDAVEELIEFVTNQFNLE